MRSIGETRATSLRSKTRASADPAGHSRPSVLWKANISSELNTALFYPDPRQTFEAFLNDFPLSPLFKIQIDWQTRVPLGAEPRGLFDPGGESGLQRRLDGSGFRIREGQPRNRHRGFLPLRWRGWQMPLQEHVGGSDTESNVFVNRRSFFHTIRSMDEIETNDSRSERP